MYILQEYFVKVGEVDVFPLGTEQAILYSMMEDETEDSIVYYQDLRHLMSEFEFKNGFKEYQLFL